MSAEGGTLGLAAPTPTRHWRLWLFALVAVLGAGAAVVTVWTVTHQDARLFLSVTNMREGLFDSHGREVYVWNGSTSPQTVEITLQAGIYTLVNGAPYFRQCSPADTITLKAGEETSFPFAALPGRGPAHCYPYP